MDYLRGILGIAILIGIAFLFSNNRKAIDWRLVGIGITLQIIFGFLLQIPLVQSGFDGVSGAFVKFLSYAGDGAQFLFGGLARNSYVFENANHNLGVVFAFQILPVVIFFSTVTAGLYYLGVLQKVVFGIAWVMSKTMRLSGAESLSAAGNIFLGQTEAPLLVRPFIAKMTKSEIMCLMTGGMATIAGSVLVAFVAFLGKTEAEQTMFASYLLSASIMNAPAAIVIAKILIPETEPDKIDRNLTVNKDSIGVNLIDALSNGAADGLKLALNIGAMLLAFIAIIFALNGIIKDWFGDITGLNEWVITSTGGQFDGFSLQYILGQGFRLFAWVIGIDWSETLQVGSLLGQKTVINEFIAYDSLAQMKAAGTLSPRAVGIATYALCGFANFSSIAIQIGGIGGMAPNQQATLSRLGMRALLGGTFACFLTATIAGAIMTF
ncbi:MAG: CNT family concentrative nucleoside transporter [Flammeovirgaceae bacterium]|jgi:CNT family concentrative nucleoside transporter